MYTIVLYKIEACELHMKKLTCFSLMYRSNVLDCNICIQKYFNIYHYQRLVAEMVVSKCTRYNHANMGHLHHDGCWVQIQQEIFHPEEK